MPLRLQLCAAVVSDTCLIFNQDWGGRGWLSRGWWQLFNARAFAALVVGQFWRSDKVKGGVTRPIFAAVLPILQFVLAQLPQKSHSPPLNRRIMGEELCFLKIVFMSREKVRLGWILISGGRGWRCKKLCNAQKGRSRIYFMAGPRIRPPANF